MNRIRRKSARLALPLLALAAFGMAGCEVFDEIGKGIEEVGEGIGQGVEDVWNGLTGGGDDD